MPSRVDVAGKPVVISGASSGIGAAAAVSCATRGMPVVLFARREEKLDAVAERVRGAGGAAHVVVGSVDSYEDCARAVDACVERFGSVYGVLANAGYGQEAPCSDMDDDAVRAMFETNFYGSLRLVRPGLERMRGVGAGHVVFVSSCLSKIGLPRYGCYSATKAAQDHFARAMRHELRSEGIHVSSVHPIGTKTEFFETAAAKSGGSLELAGSGERFMQPASRVGEAIARCFEKPRGEVWTSTLVRLGLAATVAAPGLTDWALARKMKKRVGDQ